MKIKIEVILLLKVFLVIYYRTEGQSIRFYSTFNIDNHTSLSIDRRDHIYVADQSGSIFKYDQEGNLLLTYSSERLATITKIEAGMTNKIFIFYDDIQQYCILDRFLSLISRQHIPDDLVGYGHIATLAPDNNIWIIDDNDFSLKKISSQYTEILLVSPFNLLLDNDKYDIVDITEYQNRLYICDLYKGILVYDNLGNYLKTISISGLEKLSFYRNYLLVPGQNKLKLVNLYQSENRDWVIKSITDSDNMVCGEKYLYIVDDQVVSVYRID